MRYGMRQKYFQINVLKRTHFTMTISDVLKCQGGSVKICPAKQPNYSAEFETCVSVYTSIRRMSEQCLTVWCQPTYPPRR
jgi:hypothetical protein